MTFWLTNVIIPVSGSLRWNNLSPQQDQTVLHLLNFWLLLPLAKIMMLTVIQIGAIHNEFRCSLRNSHFYVLTFSFFTLHLFIRIVYCLKVLIIPEISRKKTSSIWHVCKKKIKNSNGNENFQLKFQYLLRFISTC